MPRFLRYAIAAAAGILIGAVLILATIRFSGVQVFDWALGSSPAVSEIPGEISPADLTAHAYKVLETLKNGDYDALSEEVHPEYGVVFSPYATVSLSSSKCFTAAEIEKLQTDSSAYVWGVYDGEGSPIELTPAEYMASFVFDRDYTRANVVGVDYVLKTGNALENMTTEFPDIRFVEFHFPGDKSADYINWSSLRLGFEQYRGELKLTLVLHSVWTI